MEKLANVSADRAMARIRPSLGAFYYDGDPQLYFRAKKKFKEVNVV